MSQRRALDAIRSIARTQKTDDLAALCAEMQEIASRATESDRAAIYLVDRPNNELVLGTAPLGYDGAAAREYDRRPLDGPIMGRVASTLEPAVFSAAALPDPLREAALQAGFVEFAVVPLCSEGVLSGTLNLARTYPEPYTQETIDLANMLAEQVSVQIERARLYLGEKERVEKLASLNEDLRNSLDELSRTQGELLRKERLASLGELAMVVAHEVRNPLAVIFNVVSQLRKIPTEENGAPLLLRVLDEEANRLDRIVKDFLDFGRPTRPQLRAVALDALVASAVELTSRSFASCAVSWRVMVDDDIGMIEADEHLLRQALVNVLINAAQAQSGRGTVWIMASKQPVGAVDHVQLTIEDEGSALPDGYEQVFEPFFTTKAFGTGLGLTIVKQTIEAHGGNVHVGPREGGGTTVTIVLPLGGGG